MDVLIFVLIVLTLAVLFGVVLHPLWFLLVLVLLVLLLR